MNVAIIATLGIVILLLNLCIIILILHIIKFRKYVDKYNNVWNKFEGSDLQYDIEELIKNMEKTRQISEKAKNSTQEIETSIAKCLQKVGFVKYDAYDNSGNGLSFALAILDNNEDGIVINSLYTRSGSNIYAKQITKGKCEGTLCEEEKKAIQIAKNTKTFM